MTTSMPIWRRFANPPPRLHADCRLYHLLDGGAQQAERCHLPLSWSIGDRTAAPLTVEPKPDIGHRMFLIFSKATTEDEESIGQKTVDWKKIVESGQGYGSWKTSKFSVLLSLNVSMRVAHIWLAAHTAIRCRPKACWRNLANQSFVQEWGGMHIE